MTDLEFTFEEETHTYRNGAGEVRPGVTSTLTAQGIFDFSMVPPAVLENARIRGKNVHRWCAELDLHGGIDETWIAQAEYPYVEAWIAFRRDFRPHVLEVEVPRLGLIGGVEVGGTPDLIARLGLVTYIIDRKACAQKHPGWGLQLADYEMLRTRRSRCGQIGRMSVQLLPTRKYAITVYEDPRDAYAATAAVNLTAWDDQANDVNADHARATLAAWKYNNRLKGDRRE